MGDDATKDVYDEIVKEMEKAKEVKINRVQAKKSNFMKRFLKICKLSLWSSKAGVGNLFSITGRKNRALSLVGRKNK